MSLPPFLILFTNSASNLYVQYSFLFKAVWRSVNIFDFHIKIKVYGFPKECHKQSYFNNFHWKKNK